MFLGRLPFAEHIKELRQRLKVVAISFLIILLIVMLAPVNPVHAFENPGQYINLQFLTGTVVAWFLGQVHSYLLPKTWTLIAAGGIGEGMEIYFVASIILALAFEMPILAYETYKFVDPALKEDERKLIYPFVTSSSILFVVGLLFGYYVLAKFLIIALAPFLQASGIAFYIDAASFYYVVFLIIGATGVSFTSPVFVYTLIRLQISEADFFSRNRVIIWFLIWVVTGLFLTPDGGPLLDVVIFIPIVTMVEIAVVLGRRSVRGKPPREGRGKPKYPCPSCGTVFDKPLLFCEKCGKSMA